MEIKAQFQLKGLSSPDYISGPSNYQVKTQAKSQPETHVDCQVKAQLDF